MLCDIITLLFSNPKCKTIPYHTVLFLKMNWSLNFSWLTSDFFSENEGMFTCRCILVMYVVWLVSRWRIFYISINSWLTSIKFLLYYKFYRIDVDRFDLRLICLYLMVPSGHNTSQARIHISLIFKSSGFRVLGGIQRQSLLTHTQWKKGH